MTTFTRRGAVKASVLATVAGGGAAANPAAAAGGSPPIDRYEKSPALPGLPAISWAVRHGGVVHLAGVTANPAKPDDVRDQTRQVLARIDALLAKAGTDKSRLLSAQVWLTDMANFAAHNDGWNEWVDRANPPVRACLLSPQLWRPGLLVEIMVTAAA